MLDVRMYSHNEINFVGLLSSINHKYHALINYIDVISEEMVTNSVEVIDNDCLAKPGYKQTISKTATILSVDDEDSNHQCIEMFLHGTKYNLVKAYGGKEALDYLKSNTNSVDLVLLDLMMPDMYGLKVLEEIKKDPILEKIPVILQTAIFDNTEIEKAQNLGIKLHLRKPYQKDELLASVGKSLGE
jgi:two-component system sensor histidine kinase ChiS